MTEWLSQNIVAVMWGLAAVAALSMLAAAVIVYAACRVAGQTDDAARRVVAEQRYRHEDKCRRGGPRS